MNSKFIKGLREIIEERGLKIAFVAKKAGMMKEVLYNILEERRKEITLEEAMDISRALEVDIDYIIEKGEQ